MVLGLVSSVAALTDALTLVPSPTDRDMTDLRTRTKFTMMETITRVTFYLTNPNTTLSDLFSFSFILLKCSVFNVNFPPKPN